MIVNGKYLLEAAPILGMVEGKMVGKGGTSFGLGEAGYDIRIKQDIRFTPHPVHQFQFCNITVTDKEEYRFGRFALASAIEEFQMPKNLTGIVHDKSTWARRGLQVFNTVIEPGWKGFLTLELAYWGETDLVIPAGSGIAQVIFHEVMEPRAYTGKYQGQANEPVKAINSL